MVWATCMVCFQALLLAGYLYVHLLARFHYRTQAAVHTILLTCSSAVMLFLAVTWGNPILPGEALKPIDSAHPAGRILMILLMSIGAPFTLLAATAPLLQNWYAGLHQGRTSYRFYALSNTGSLLGLLVYPLVVEPILRLGHQGVIWSMAYLTYAISCSLCGIQIWRHAANGSHKSASKPHTDRTSLSESVIWMGLAAGATFLLLATTNVITSNVAPVPLLWILPLTAYLLTFILAFSGRFHIPLWVTAPLAMGCAFWALWTLWHTLSTPIWFQLAAYHAFLFAGCFLCHNALYARRPTRGGTSTTHYYLMISLGGVIGGMAVALGAPLLFSSHVEFHMGIAIVGVLTTLALFRQPRIWAKPWRLPAVVACAVLLLLLHAELNREQNRIILASRNFFGAIKVSRQEKAPGIAVHSLLHGKVCHGLQFTAGPNHRKPSAYFGEYSGLGQAIAAQRARSKQLRVGILGMGIGVISAYGQAGDYIHYYEIDPEVVELALNRDYFTYLTDSPAQIDVTLGDARLALERQLDEGHPGNLDLLIVDIFSGDAIAVHFLTREAFSVYLDHLRDGGILAFHVSNAFVDLAPPIAAAASDIGWHTCTVSSAGDLNLTSDSTWIVLSRDPVQTLNDCIPAEETHSILWTDDYSSILPLLKTRQ